MTTLADYYVIQASKRNLDVGHIWGGGGPGRDDVAGESVEFSFEVTSDMVSSGGSKRPFLTFFVDPSSDAEEIYLQVRINGSELMRYCYSGGVGRAHIEILRHEDLQIGGPNTLLFFRMAPIGRDKGTISFSDVVLWFQRDVDI